MLSRTRRSLFFVAAYLLITGIAFLAVPVLSLRVLFSDREYDPVFVRFVGSLMVALSVVVIQVIRHRVEVLYPTTILIRVLIIGCVAWFYLATRNPLFIAILAVVVIGVVSTSLSLLADRSARK